MTDAQVMEAQLVELSVVVKRFLSVFAGCTSWTCPRRADLLFEEGIASCP